MLHQYPPFFYRLSWWYDVKRTKYNVGKNTENRTCNGIVFDSAMEMRFYRDVVLPQVESGRILHYELQKQYELQPEFIHDGKKVRAITYVADFYIEYADGSIIVVDTKGAADSMAKCKRKLFWYNYPYITYQWITYIKKYGGWIEWDEAIKIRKIEKTKKKKEMEERENAEE